jgi:Tfp pilus assembly protein FimT
MVTGLPKYRIKRAARDITSKIRAARSEAIKTADDITIEFDLVNNRYRIDDQWYPEGSLSDHYGSVVSFGVGDGATAPNGECGFNEDGECKGTFNSRGMLSSACLSPECEIQLTNTEGAAYRIVVNTAGNISLQQGIGSDWK